MCGLRVVVLLHDAFMIRLKFRDRYSDILLQNFFWYNPEFKSINNGKPSCTQCSKATPNHDAINARVTCGLLDVTLSFFVTCRKIISHAVGVIILLDIHSLGE